MMEPRYAPEKPDDCGTCRFCHSGRCRLTPENCYYLTQVPPSVRTECDGCPYGRHQPCIGWCMRTVMRGVGLL